jgi:maltooligosyltrehalose trehalohydrolase
MKHGFLYQGQWYSWQKQPRGRAGLDLRPAAFVTFLENHDQVANTSRGWHLQMYISQSKYRALAALMLLGPPTPMLFQGQEFASSSPFLYFADHQGDLGSAVRAGRVEFLRQFPSYARPDVVAQLADPGARDTFDRCKMNHAERRIQAHVWQFHADLLQRRKNDATLASLGAHGVDGAVIAPEAFLLRIFGETPPDDRLIVVNLGADLHLAHQPEPLMAPPDGTEWSVEWCSEDPRYGGSGAAIEVLRDWRMPAESTLLLAPRVRHDPGGEAPDA